jgi:hypothetical protein
MKNVRGIKPIARDGKIKNGGMVPSRINFFFHALRFM